VSICNLHRKTLKEFLVDGVEKELFLRKVLDGPRGSVDGLVKAVEALQKAFAAE